MITGPAILLAFFFASCEESIEIEGDLVPGGNNTEIRYLEIPLDMNHTAYDSLLISTNVAQGASGQIFVGHQNSSEIGEVSAEAYFGALLNTDFVRDSLPQNATVVQTRLKLGLNYYHGDGFDKPQNFIVSQLDDTLAISGRLYTIYDEIAAGNRISLDEEISVNPTDTIPDYVQLSNIFGRNLLNLVKNEDLSPVEIYNTLRGFKIETEAENNNLQAISLASGESFIEIIYESPLLDSLKSVTFNISGSSFTNVDYTPSALVPSDYSGKKSFDLSDPSKAYYNGLIGISPRIDLQNYLNFIDTVQFLQINKAELVIGSEAFAVTENASTQLRPANSIIPYILTDDGNVAKQGEDFWALQANFNPNGAPANPTQATSPISLAYDNNKKEIKGDISFFLQEIYNNPDLWEEEYDFMFTGQFIRRNETPFNEIPKINIGNFDNFLVDKENIKLKIYYTTFK
ncbi:hypothetical protein SAMN05661096_01273 [Marivirga sericea]|uniref:DUF4270 domain-containing protein n=2 Tax=Marivirga sericea TaxID=1028 RepID=A0A1X7J5R6_9BACT|nr:hypothetical protein SAMN05661096_01273 [Marivirga sericea]